ncbi:MAG: PepSY domain-containing protein [Pseudomonadota bacterium]
MIKTTLKILPIIAAISLSANVAQAHFFGFGSKDNDITNAKLAKITMVEAINKVMRSHDGIIITANLEQKDDDQLVYEIDLIQNDQEMEIWVDARTGQMSELMDD